MLHYYGEVEEGVLQVIKAVEENSLVLPLKGYAEKGSRENLGII